MRFGVSYTPDSNIEKLDPFHVDICTHQRHANPFFRYIQSILSTVILCFIISIILTPGTLHILLNLLHQTDFCVYIQPLLGIWDTNPNFGLNITIYHNHSINKLKHSRSTFDRKIHLLQLTESSVLGSEAICYSAQLRSLSHILLFILFFYFW